MVASRSVSFRFSWLPFLSCLAVACGARSGLVGERGSEGDIGPDDTGGPAAQGIGGSESSGGANACPGSGGPAMVRLPEGYCIDSTEVTRAQYQAWIDTNPTSLGQPGSCARKTTFTPDETCMTSQYVCQSDCDSHPQVCVDWCAAYAYCSAVGKHLCGKIGGGPVTSDIPYDWVREDVSEWYNACSSHGSSVYVYATNYDPSTCNGGDLGLLTTVPVGTLDGCQSPFPEYAGVFDLLGNAAEWENSCVEPGANCRTRGRDFYTSSSVSGTIPDMRCNTDSVDYESSALWYVGFRCCS